MQGYLKFLCLEYEHVIKHLFIGGTTIHTALGMKNGHQYYPLSRQKLDYLRDQLDSNLALTICDEMSMISPDFLYGIHKRLVEIRICDDSFGGIGMNLFGDIMQLPPVKASPIYCKPSSAKHAILWDSDENLWNKFKVVVLEVNFRQGVENKWVSCLNNIRVITNGNLLSEDDINLLMSRKVSNFPNKEEIMENAVHTFFTNKKVNAYNSMKLSQINSPIVTMKAKLPSPKYYTPNISEHGTVDDTQFLDILQLKIGAKVMLIHNVDLMDDLVNGQMGHVVDFLYDGK